MTLVSSSRPLEDMGKLVNESHPVFRGLYSLNLVASQQPGIMNRSVSPQCGSTGDVNSDDDVDDEIINVTDEDEVVMSTTDPKSTEILQDNKKCNKDLQEKQGPNAKVYQRRPKPPFSYIALIAMAIKDSPTGKLTLAEINDYLMKKFPFFRGPYTGWRNSVRHNLSLNECFRKILRDPSRPWGKDNYWTINPNSEYTFADGVFRRRRKRLARKYSHMSSHGVMTLSPTPSVTSQGSSSCDPRSDSESTGSPVPFSIDSILSRKGPQAASPPSQIWQTFVPKSPPLTPVFRFPMSAPHCDAIPTSLYVSQPVLGYKQMMMDPITYQHLIHAHTLQSSFLASRGIPGLNLGDRERFFDIYARPGAPNLGPPRMVPV
ncbi:uncharacterized protein LOC143452816 [Clavelina lepadiformis]|uniref:uncharacterized protein LOC143452816 n=1 Tax=Clavelina lepadiformis TaxID=159417 RepID=UPI0040429476